MQNYLDFKNKIDDAKLRETAEIIKGGKIVVFPTETVYGIGANAFNEDAIKKIYSIKERSLSKPISLLVNSINMIEQVAKNITSLEYALIQNFFPGPLTIILKKKDIIPDIVTSNLDTVGIRMPANEIALKLIDYANVPIATSSANISKKESRTNIKDVMNDFGKNVDYFIDGGPSQIGLASTIVQIINGLPKILRQGSISEKQIKDFCSEYNTKN